MVRGRVEDCGDGSVFDELRPAAHEKIPLAEFRLAIFRPQVDQATGARAVKLPLPEAPAGRSSKKTTASHPAVSQA
jgi:hypothetical protein